MRAYLLNLSDIDHKRIKLEATEREISIKQFIMLCIQNYLENDFYDVNQKDLIPENDIHQQLIEL